MLCEFLGQAFWKKHQFIKDGKEYKIRNRTGQMVQASKSGLNHPAKDIATGVAVMEAKRKLEEDDKLHC